MLRKLINKYREAKLFYRDCKFFKQNSKICYLSDYRRLHKDILLSKEEYLNFKFDSCDKEFRESFLPYCLAEKYWEVLNPYKYASIARDKFIMHCLFREFNIPSAPLYAVLNTESAKSGGVICCTKEKLLEIIKKHPVAEFVVKPAADSAHGDGVFIGDIECIKENISKGYFLIEGKIEQTAQMNKFNPSSVNTIRIMTALYPEGNVKIIAAFLRIGRKGAFADNAGSGGNVDCAVDIDSGSLYNAVQFESFNKVIPIEKHPDSDTQINGAIIEGWKEVKEKLKYWQAQIPFLKIIGWDVALTDNGPVIIEINNWWDTVGQLFIRRGWKKEVRECYDAWKTYYGSKK